MKKYQVLILIVIAVLTLTPTGILIVEASSAGNFPSVEEVDRIEITLSGGAKQELPMNSPRCDVLFFLFENAKRIRYSALPEEAKFDSYRLDLHVGEIVETVRVMIDKSDFSCYLRSSENKYFCLAMPRLSIGTSRLGPAKMYWYNDGEADPALQYPDKSVEDLTDEGINGNKLVDWSYLKSVSFSQEGASVKYSVYNDAFERIGVVDTADEALALSPSRVLMTVIWEMDYGVSLHVSYYFYV